MFKAVIFDMDGLMFDTEALAAEAWRYTAEKFGLKITDRFLAKIRGVDVNHAHSVFIEEFGEDVDFFELRSSAYAYMVDNVDANGIPVKEGLYELLEFLRNNDIKIALATSTENKRAVYYLSTANVLGYFDKIICGDMVENGKPCPDIYLKAVKSLGFEPEECLVLEDSPNGTLAAAGAGSPVIVVPDLDKPDDKTKRLALDVVKDLSQVEKKLKSGF